VKRNELGCKRGILTPVHGEFQNAEEIGDSPRTPSRRVPLWAAGLGIVVLAGGAAVWRFASQRPPPITDRDTILVADFVNKTPVRTSSTERYGKA
jgi:hypothetical protein